ncbi:hypothetical protein HDU91_002686 [Kappamyces sp. JEL0680]|nr:hypothetical protein HDU91_002686 [Kappamyces sp. JEL0680]
MSTYSYFIAVPGVISFILTSGTLVAAYLCSNGKREFASSSPESSKNKSAVDGSTEQGKRQESSNPLGRRTTDFAPRTNGQKIQKVLTPTYDTSRDWMILSMLCCDLLQTFGSQMSFVWLVEGRIDSPAYAALCYAQGFILTLADLLSSFWATAICLDVVISSQYILIPHFNKIVAMVCWVVPTLLTLLIVAKQGPSRPLAFNNNGNGGWCFIGPLFPDERVWNHYAWVILCIIVNMSGYGFLVYRLLSFADDVQGKAKKQQLKTAIMKMIPYPVAFFFLFTPIAIDRVLRLLKIPPPNLMTAFFFGFLMLDGAVNSVLYIRKRNLIRRLMMSREEPKIEPVAVSVEQSRLR